MVSTLDSKLSARFATAQQHHRDGHLQQAAADYSAILGQVPDHPEVLYFAGILAHQQGQFERALSLMRRGTQYAPDEPRIWLGLSTVLQGQNQFDEAAQCMEQAARLHPDPALWNNLGVIQSKLGRTVEAEQSFRRAIAMQADHPSACNNLGKICLAKESMSEAEHLFRTALRTRPEFPEAMNNLGRTLQTLGQLAEAEQQYRQALRLRPDYLNALRNLAVTCQAQFRSEEAESLLRQALAIRGEDAETHHALGQLLLALGRDTEGEAHLRQASDYDLSTADALKERGAWYLAGGMPSDATRVFRQVLRSTPDDADTHASLGMALQALGQRVDAAASYRRALELQPDFAECHVGLGALYEGQREFVEAERHYQRASEIRPNSAEARIGLVGVHRNLCLWDEYGNPQGADLERLLNDWVSSAHSPFGLLRLQGASRALCRAAAAACAAKVFALPPVEHAQPVTQVRDPRKLRVGYMSNDFGEHPVSQLLVEIIERHDRSRFEVFAYSYGEPDPSQLFQRMGQAFDEFRDIAPLTHAQAAQRIAADEIDILVDLKAFTRGSRSHILAFRPAPIQVNWLGYPGTLGNPALADYLIGDPVVTPLTDAADYSEQLALMPFSYMPTDRKRPVGSKPSRRDAGLPDTGFVFCSFNQSFKLTPEVFEVWCRLLESKPQSVLWLPDYHDATRRNLATRAEGLGIPAARLIFAPRVPSNAEHLARLQLADLALDTLPYGSHSTGYDALWAGVPLVTCAGDTFQSRVGASLLNAAGLAELVAPDLDSYFRLAANLASNSESLRSVREKLWSNRQSSALFDSGRFTRDLERLFERMWSSHRAGQHQAIALDATP